METERASEHSHFTKNAPLQNPTDYRANAEQQRRQRDSNQDSYEKTHGVR
jgi:hypothetical protein